MNSARIRVLFYAIADFLSIYFSILFVACVYQKLGFGDYNFTTYLKLWPLGILFVLLNAAFRLYHGNFFYPGLAFGPVEELRRMTISLFCAYLLFTSYMFLVKGAEEYSRIVITISMVIAIFLFPFFRWLIKQLLGRLNYGSISVLIFGAGHTGRLVSDILLAYPHFGLTPVGFLDDDPGKGEGLTLPLLGSTGDAKQIAEEKNVDYAIFCLPLQIINSKMKYCTAIFNHILIVPDNKVFPAAWASPHDIDGIFALELKNQLLLKGPRILKRILESVMAFVALLTLWPLFLILALLIKLCNPGPIFYRAQRLGLNGKTISVLKFRTMHQDADKRLDDMLKENPELAMEWEKNFKLERDPRITGIGRILRKTSLDELPQFWNVLTGEMAVIGPRPIVEAEKAYYGENYEIVKRVKPGITGLWQVSGRSDTTYERRVTLDMHYIMNWSVWMDYYIFLKTVKEVLGCRGAK